MKPIPLPNSHTSFHLTEHHGLDGLYAVRGDWIRLTAGDHRYWLTFEWQEGYLLHGVREAKSIVLYALRDDQGRVLAILPTEPAVVYVRRLPFACVQITGSIGNEIAFLASGADFPAESQLAAAEAIQLLIQSLRSGPHPPAIFLIGRISADSWALSATRLLSTPSFTQVVPCGWRWLDVSRPFENISATLSGKFRISLRSCRRNLMASGEVSAGYSTVESSTFENDYRQFLAVESSGWKGNSGTRSGLLVSPTASQRQFLESIAKNTHGLIAELHWLKLDRRIIAAQLWFRYRHTRIAAKIGYLEEFAKYQPGHLLLEHVIRSSCSDPTLRTLDFISGVAWLDKWRCTTSPHHYCYIPVKPAIGALVTTLLRLPTIHSAQSAIRRLRTSMRWPR